MALFSYRKFTAQPSLEKNDCSIAAIYSPINTFGVISHVNSCLEPGPIKHKKTVLKTDSMLRAVFRQNRRASHGGVKSRMWSSKGTIMTIDYRSGHSI